jgi:hypothetical protein
VLCCIKSGQQHLAAGRENFIFFLCPLDGEQFIMAFLLDDTTLKVENYIIVIEFYKLELNKIAARWPAKAVA